MTDPTIDIDSLIGHEYDFYGVADNTLKLGGLIYEVVENESDGYRSSMEHVCVLADAGGRPFFDTPIARVRVEEESNGYSQCWKLVDVTSGHAWLRFGTDNWDDYYPCFVFDYKPAESVSPTVSQTAATSDGNSDTERTE